MSQEQEQELTPEQQNEAYEAAQAKLEGQEQPAGNQDGETLEKPGATEGQEAEPQGKNEESPSEERETGWVTRLRKKNREDAKRIRELEAQVAANQKPADDAEPVKPKLADFDYDEEQFADAVHSYALKMESLKAEKEKKAKAQQEKEREVMQLHDVYQSESKSIEDFKDAEDDVAAVLSREQQGVLLEAAKNPAKLVKLLYDNPSQLEALASEKKLARFAAAIGKIEANMKPTPSNTKPAPEKTLQGKSPVPKEGRLEELHKKAQETGDYNAYHAAKRK